MKDMVDLSGDLDNGDSGTTKCVVMITPTVIALICANAGARFMCHNAESHGRHGQHKQHRYYNNNNYQYYDENEYYPEEENKTFVLSFDQTPVAKRTCLLLQLQLQLQLLQTKGE